MKYIVTLVVLFIFIGCSDASESQITQSIDIQNFDTKNLQPAVENSDAQPPKPPVL